MLISKTSKPLSGTIHLPGSKSEANRLLIMEAISNGGLQLVENSSAADSQLMFRLLKSGDLIMDCEDAGTVMRFLCAYCAYRKGTWELRGNSRMHQRPINPLVDALRSLGAQIEYLGNVDCPPLRIEGGNLVSKKLEIEADISSQFITALLLIAPYLEHGLEIVLKGICNSKPYIAMTLTLMQQAGIRAEWNENVIKIFPGMYSGLKTIGKDFSAASYWFAALCLNPEGGDLFLPGLKEDSPQGDRIVSEIFKKFGIHSIFDDRGLRIYRTLDQKVQESDFEYDFSDCPDLAQTLVVCCAGLKMKASFSGLQSLPLKETDRISALKNELEKLGLQVSTGTDHLSFDARKICYGQPSFFGYEDHRMVMSLAMLGFVFPKIEIDDEQCVKKSYPDFWKDMSQFLNLTVG